LLKMEFFTISNFRKKDIKASVCNDQFQKISKNENLS
jgi:hypothetical protein